MPPKRIRGIARRTAKTPAKGRETRASRSVSEKTDPKETPRKEEKKTDDNVATTSSAQDDKGKGKEVARDDSQKDANKEKDKDIVTISSGEEDQGNKTAKVTTFGTIPPVWEIPSFPHKHDIYTVDVFGPIGGIPKEAEDIEEFQYESTRPSVRISAKIVDAVRSCDNTDDAQKAFLSFLWTRRAAEDRPVVKNKQELAKYGMKGQEIHVPPLVVRYGIAYDVEYKTYVGFLFSTIAGTSIAVDVYEAMMCAVYAHVDPSSNINYLTPGLLLAPFHSRYNPRGGLDNVWRVDRYKLEELEFDWVTALDLAARQDTMVGGGIPTAFVDVMRGGGSDGEKNFFTLFDQPFHPGHQIAAAMIEAWKVKEPYTEAFDHMSTVIAFKGLLKQHDIRVAWTTFGRQIDIVPYDPPTTQFVPINKKQRKKTPIVESEEEDEDVALDDNEEDEDDYLGSEDEMDIDSPDRVTLDVWKDTRQSVRFLLDDTKRKGDICAPEEAIARLHGECKGNKVLINEVAKFMENFYNRRGSRTVFSSNLYLRSIKRRLKHAVRDFIEGKPCRHLPTRPEILAARYCDPKGELNSTIAGHLAFLGLGDLIHVQTFKEKTEGVTSGTAGIGNYDAQVARMDDIAANLQDMSRRIAALENRTAAPEEVVTKEELHNGMKHVADKMNELRKNLMTEERVRAIVQEALQEPMATIDLLQKSTTAHTDSTSRALDNLKAEVQRLTSRVASTIAGTSLSPHVPVTPQHAITATPSRVSTARSTVLTRGTAALSLEEDPAKRRLFEDKTPRAGDSQDNMGQGSAKRKRTASATSTAQKKEGQGAGKYNTVRGHPSWVNLFE